MAWTDIQNGDTGLSVRTKINDHLGGLILVGEIKQAILTEAQFQSIASTDWVLADGRDVTGSAYATLTGSNAVPDLRGGFLRGLDPTGTVDPDGASRSLGDSQDDDFVSHSHTIRTWTYGGGGSYDGIATANANSFTVQTIGSDANAGVQSSGGDETRPKNVSVNYFIKIN